VRDYALVWLPRAVVSTVDSCGSGNVERPGTRLPVDPYTGSSMHERCCWLCRPRKSALVSQRRANTPPWPASAAPRPAPRDPTLQLPVRNQTAASRWPGYSPQPPTGGRQTPPLCEQRRVVSPCGGRDRSGLRECFLLASRGGVATLGRCGCRYGGSHRTESGTARRLCARAPPPPPPPRRRR